MKKRRDQVRSLTLGTLGLAIGAIAMAAPQPVLYYDFEEGSGDVVVNKGTVVGDGQLQYYDGTERTTGAPGGSTPGGGLRLNGGNNTVDGDYVATGLYADTLGIHDAVEGKALTYTACAWAFNEKSDPAVAEDSMIFGQIPAGNNFLHLGFRDQKPHFGQYGDDVTAGNQVPTGTWHHLVWQLDVTPGCASTSVQRIFVDGVMVAYRFSTGRGVKLLDPIMIGTVGGIYNGYPRTFLGQLDEIALYTNTLTLSQIRFLASGGSPTNLPEPTALDGQYFTAPTGPTGGWNLYFVEGVTSGPVRTFWDAYNVTTTNVDPVGGTTQGHLLTVQSFRENQIFRVNRGNVESWLGLSDDETYFGYTEAGHPTNQPVLATRRSIFVNWVNGEIMTYSNWNGTATNSEPNDSAVGGEDAATMRTDGTWNDVASGIPSSGQADNVYRATMIEYDLDSPTPIPGARLPTPVLPPAPLSVGPIGSNGTFTVVEVRGNGGLGDMRAAVNSLTNGGGTRVTGQVSRINGYDTQVTGSINSGLFPSNSPYFGDTPVNDTNNVVFLYRGRIRIDTPGQYTFGVHSDDGFALRIVGQTWQSASGNGWIDPGDPSTLTFETGTGDSNTRGVINLAAGEYDIEFVNYNGTGGTHHELYAAQGAFVNDADTGNWRLVGHTSVGAIPVPGVKDVRSDGLGWTLVATVPPYSNQITTLTLARQALTTWNTNGGTYAAFNHNDPGYGGPGSIPNDEPFPGLDDGAANDDFAAYGTAVVVVPEDGWYQLGFQGDDGGELRIIGQVWDRIVFKQNAASTNIGDTIKSDFTTSNSRCIGAIYLYSGTQYTIETTFFERGGNAYHEVFGGGSPANLALIPGAYLYQSLTTGGAGYIQDIDGLPLIGPSAPVEAPTPQILAFAYDAGASAVSVTWVSQSGFTYRVLYNTNLTAGAHWDPAVWAAVTNGIQAQSDTNFTTVAIPDFLGTPWPFVTEPVFIFGVKKE